MPGLIATIKSHGAAEVEAALDADPGAMDVADEQGLTPLLCSLYYRKPEVTALLLRRGATVNFFEAAALGDVSRMQALAEPNPDLPSRYSLDGWTALHLAAFFNQPAAARWLLEHGAAVSRESSNAQHNQPLHAAAAGNATSVAALLLERGAGADARQPEGFTPLMSAAANGNVELARLLVAHGASRETRANNGQTALDLAMTRGHRAIVELLESPGQADSATHA